jgi:hypothetical protein
MIANKLIYLDVKAVKDLSNNTENNVLDRIDYHLIQAQHNAGLWKDIFKDLVRIFLNTVGAA